MGVTIPEELRPASKDGEDDDEVELSEDGENLILRRRFSDSQTIFDIHSRKATIFNRDKVSPKIADTDRPFGNRTTSTRSSKFLHAVAMEVANTTRVTVWSFDYENTVFDEQFKGGFEYLDLTDLETRSTVTIVHDSVFEIVVINRTSDKEGTSIKYSVGNRIKVNMPKEFGGDLSNLRFGLSGPITIAPLNKRIVVVETLKTRTVFWIFNPNVARFDDPVIGTQAVVVRMRDKDARARGYAWIPEGGGSLRIWLPDSEPIQIDGIPIRSTDRIELSSDRRRMMVVSDDGVGEFWDIDFPRAKASRVLRIALPGYNDFSFSADEKLILMRRSGGLYHAWNRDGVDLGSLGIVGSDLVSSSYRSECKQILLWTSEGQRLDLRRGFYIPLYGFLPERDCSAKKSVGREYMDKFFIYFFG